MKLWAKIAESISTATGILFEITDKHAVSGGCINDTYRLDGNDHSYFVKIHQASHLAMFEAEAAGLNELTQTKTIRVPKSVCYGATEDRSFLVTEFINFHGSADMKLFGEQLAALHQHTSSTFGWRINNTIGSTAQINTPSTDWVKFWQSQRLGFQLHLAAQNGHGGRLQVKGNRLMALIPQLLADHAPSPSLLHGDLWGGNYASDHTGNPVIFDPAVYYGDREADLAMTELFGGFNNIFYNAYRDAWPLNSGYRVRKTFYNIYHILNHLNLFGGGYGHQAEQMIELVLSELGH